MSNKSQGHSLILVKGHSDFKVKCLTFGLYTQVSNSGPQGPLVFNTTELSSRTPYTGEIHKKWSLANNCPLFKKGDRFLSYNYEPVSLGTLCKFLEHIPCSNIMARLDEHKLVSDRQNAFRKKA